ncbi:MAG: HK97 gp10 family phage protein [Xanthobacteraceae bacterium]
MSVVENRNFAASVDSFVRETEQRMLAVFRESTQRTASIANNGVPVDTGFARASIRASTESMPQINPNAKGKEGAAYPADFGNVTLTIAGAELGQTIYVGWTAAYMLPLEFGHSKQAPSGFVRLAAAQWQHTVDQVTAELRARSGVQ